MRSDIQFKLLVVEDYLTGQQGYKIVASRHDIRWETVRKWVRAYHARGKAGLQRKYERYSAAFRQSVVQRMC
ncbi:transposase [Azomonas macrocytogenes]|uniref:Transposase-like protein n=1 Tax=Azomonas macrocytogenes TaxID=69962 RepID=A0A839T8G4_AZOMA|nr:transposase-like protein [Azomonas macrocytogenes]